MCSWLLSWPGWWQLMIMLMMIISKILIIPNIDFTTRYSNQFLFFLSFTSTILEVKKAYSLDPLYCIQQTLLYCAKPNTHTTSLPASSWQIQAIAISKKDIIWSNSFQKGEFYPPSCWEALSLTLEWLQCFFMMSFNTITFLYLMYWCNICVADPSDQNICC